MSWEELLPPLSSGRLRSDVDYYARGVVEGDDGAGHCDEDGYDGGGALGGRFVAPEMTSETFSS